MSGVLLFHVPHIRGRASLFLRGNTACLWESSETVLDEGTLQQIDLFKQIAPSQTNGHVSMNTDPQHPKLISWFMALHKLGQRAL